MNERDVFIAALQKSHAAERQAFLDASCGQDTALRRHVEGLLQAHAGAGNFLQASPAASAAPDAAEEAQRPPEMGQLFRQVLAALKGIIPEDPSAAVRREEPALTAPAAGCLGDYRLLREVGRGGMGVVHEAEQISLGRRVALKVLPFASTLDARQLQRFKNEAQAAAHLHHAHIVPVFATGCERGVHYYAMQFIEGQTLAAVVDDLRQLAGRKAGDGAAHTPHPVSELVSALASGRWAPSRDNASSLQRTGIYRPAAENPTTPTDPSTRPAAALSTERSHTSAAYFRTVASLGVQAASALDYAHQQGVVHRDVKPANLLLDLGGKLWVTDFGLAHCQSQAGLTMTGDLLGTLRYMSPEQALAQRVVVDHRTDIYSLGVTLYELLTLEPVFPGRDRQELLRQIAFDEPKPLRHLNRDVPRELETIVLKAIEKNPAERYLTAQEVADDLQRFLNDEPVRAQRATMLQKASKWGRRNRTLVRAAGVMFVFALAALTVATVLIGQANHNLNLTLERERYGSYLQRIALAEREWSANNLPRAEDLLDQCPPNVRGWEWHYLKHLRRGQIPPLRHRACVMGVAVSPAGDRLACSDTEGGITIWNARAYQQLLHFRAHAGIAYGVAFSGDGTRIASAGDHADCSVKIWDAVTGKLLWQLDGHTSDVRSVAFAPDSRRLASFGGSNDGNGEIRLWDTASGKLLQCLPADSDWGQVAFTRDGQQVICACGSEVRVWDVATGLATLHIPCPTATLWCVALSPDGRWIAAGSGMHGRRKNGEVILWDVQTGQELRTLHGHVEMVQAVAFSPDGRRLVSGGFDQMIKLWDVETGQETLNLRGHTGVISGLAFAADGRLFTSADDATVRVWDGRTWNDEESGQEFLTLRGHGDGVTSVAFGPQGRWLASGDSGGTVKLWAPFQGREPQTLLTGRSGVYSVAFAADGTLLAAGGENFVKVWQAATGKEMLNVSENGVYVSLAISPDGRYLAYAGWQANNAVQFWDLRDGKKTHRLLGSTWGVNAMAFQPTAGRYLVTASDDGKVLLWDWAAATPPHPLPPRQEGRVRGVAFSLDGHWLATGGWDRTVRIWDSSSRDPKEWKQVQMLTDPTGAVECVAFSPDGRHLAWGGTDSAVKVWEIDHGRTPDTIPLIHTLRGHSSWVRSVAFSPDSQHIASGGQDGTVKIWPVPAKQAK